MAITFIGNCIFNIDILIYWYNSTHSFSKFKIPNLISSVFKSTYPPPPLNILHSSDKVIGMGVLSFKEIMDNFFNSTIPSIASVYKNNNKSTVYKFNHFLVNCRYIFFHKICLKFSCEMNFFFLPKNSKRVILSVFKLHNGWVDKKCFTDMLMVKIDIKQSIP